MINLSFKFYVLQKLLIFSYLKKCKKSQESKTTQYVQPFFKSFYSIIRQSRSHANALLSYFFNLIRKLFVVNYLSLKLLSSWRDLFTRRVFICWQLLLLIVNVLVDFRKHGKTFSLKIFILLPLYHVLLILSKCTVQTLWSVC